MNPSQLEAVHTTEGPLLLIAGPGSGKTLTLVNRIVHLLVEKKVPPECIMVSTFTRKAALELQSRLITRLQEEKAEVQLQDLRLGTLHSIFLSILEKYRHLTRLRKGFRLLDDFEAQYLVYEHLEEFLQIDNAVHLTLKEGSFRDPTRASQSKQLLYWLNKVNEELLDVQRLIDSYDVPVRALGLAYRLYESILERENALDFGTIQSVLVQLFQEHPEALGELLESVRYIMIDEYQDTNTIQELLILKLTQRYKNLCVVGDDDQSIYRFRGATVQNILRFEERFDPGACKVIRLEVNYRSHPRIINFYTKWMEQCSWSDGYGGFFRWPKTITPHKADSGRTSRVIKLTSDRNEKRWHEEVAAFLLTLMDQGIISNWNQVAFLFWSVRNDSVKQLIRYLEGQGIPVFAPRTHSYFEREEVRLILGVYAVLAEVLLEEREIPSYMRECAALLRRYAREPIHQPLVEWVKSKRAYLMSGEPCPSLVLLLYELLQFPMFEGYMRTEYTGDVRDTRQVRNVAALTQWVGRFEKLPGVLELEVRSRFERFMSFIDYVQEIGEDEYEDESDYAPSGSVSFFTFHQSKGLEFPIVVAGSLDAVPDERRSWIEESLRPLYSRPPFEPLGQTGEYDFYRLYYTAFSRAQELLVLTGDQRPPDHRGRGKVPSEPIEPLFNRLLNWRDPRIHLDELKVGVVKPISLLKSYAYTSDVVLYRSCPRKYLLGRVFGFEEPSGASAQLGTLVHLVIEEIHQAMLLGQSVTEEQVGAWIRSHLVPDGGGREAMLELADRAYVHLVQYLLYLRENPAEIQATELAVSGLVGGYLMTGQVDALVKRDGLLEVMDFKTGRPPKTEEGLESYRNQLLLYAALLRQRGGVEVRQLRLLFTGSPLDEMSVRFQAGEEEIAAASEQIRDTLSRIEARDFAVLAPDLSVCGRCVFRFYCKDVGPREYVG